MSKFMFTAGPWNIHEGNETFGPGHRKTVGLEEKMTKFAEIGMSGMQFHDDDAVPEMLRPIHRDPFHAVQNTQRRADGRSRAVGVVAAVDGDDH